MVAAGGFVVGSSTADQAQQALAQLGPFAFSMESGYQWAYRANLTLASLNRQIDELAFGRTGNGADSARVDPHPPAVAELESRLALLRQHRTVLLSQLAAWESLQRSQVDLAAAEAQLARADRALRESPVDARSSPQVLAARQQLVAIRDLRREQRDAKAAEREPCGAPSRPPCRTRCRTTRPTTAVAGAVHDLVTAGSRLAEAKQRQVSCPPRDGNADRPRADVGTAAPPGGRSGDELIGTVGGSAGDDTATADDVGCGPNGRVWAGGSGPSPVGCRRAGRRPAGCSRSEATPVRRGRVAAARRRRSPMVRSVPGGRPADAAIAYGMAWAEATGHPAAGRVGHLAGRSDTSDAADCTDTSDELRQLGQLGQRFGHGLRGRRRGRVLDL